MNTLHRDLRFVLVSPSGLTPAVPDQHLLLRSTSLQSENGFRRLSRLAVVESQLDARGEISHRHLRQTTDLAGLKLEWNPQGTSATLSSKGGSARWSLPFEDPHWAALTPKSGRFLRLKHATLGGNPVVQERGHFQGWDDPERLFGKQFASALWIEGPRAPRRALQISVSHPTFACVAQVLPRPRLFGYHARLGERRGHSKNLWDYLKGRVTLEKDLWRAEMQLGELTVRVEMHPTKKFGYQMIGENSDGAPHVLSVVPFCETEVHVYQGTKLQATHRLGRAGTLFQSSEEPHPYSSPLT